LSELAAPAVEFITPSDWKWHVGLLAAKLIHAYNS
jgi:hypothetical protein